MLLLYRSRWEAHTPSVPSNRYSVPAKTEIHDMNADWYLKHHCYVFFTKWLFLSLGLGSRVSSLIVKGSNHSISLQSSNTFKRALFWLTNKQRFQLPFIKAQIWIHVCFPVSEGSQSAGSPSQVSQQGVLVKIPRSDLIYIFLTERLFFIWKVKLTTEQRHVVDKEWVLCCVFSEASKTIMICEWADLASLIMGPFRRPLCGVHHWFAVG